MNKIKILPPEQAIKIAAGEVVERPINIIKEVVENSIDAGATKISIFIHQAGKQLIKIIDNGCGMSPEDAKLSVAPHATSKLNTVEDLDAIATFGFRGEALASINAVSQLTITTKTAEAQTGTCIAWNFGALIQESIVSHPTGTTLEIANLFDNIPARKKFLKKDETEWRSIVTLFQAFCLDYINIHFQLYNEHGLQYNCPAVHQLADRMVQLFDTTLHNKNIELVHLENNLCDVTGIISSPHYYRYDRNQIFIFVNNRWVKNIDLTKAIMKGYAGTLPPQKYPAAIIFIKIAQDQVDVNIHPKKEEIKFLHPKKVESIIINSIKATLEESILKQLIPSTQTLEISTPPIMSQTTPQPMYEQLQKPVPFSFLNNGFHTLEQNYETDIESETKKEYETNFATPTQIHDTEFANEQPLATTTFMPAQFEQQETAQTFHPAIPALEQLDEEQMHMLTEHADDIILIGQYKLTYLLIEKDNNLIFIDQHAAHERILYEQFKANFQNIPHVKLIFPEFIKFSVQDIQTIAPYLSLLQDHGIYAEIFSETQLLIQATPVHLKNLALQETLQQIIGWIYNLDETNPERIQHLLNEKIHTKMACSAAIKAGDRLNFEQMIQLLQDLQEVENRFSCPHGRPTYWVLPIDHIEKQFKRDYSKKSEQFYDFL